MINNLISDQKNIYSTHLHVGDLIEPMLGSINQNGNLETAILLSEGKAQSFLLFIFQGRLFAAYKLIGNQMMPILFSDYFEKISKVGGKLDLYLLSPVLFKALLTLGQMKPRVVANSNLVDIEQLLAHIDQKKEEALLLLKRGTQVNLFYFSEGSLCDGYLEETEEMHEESNLRDKLLVYAYSSQKEPASILLYEEITVSPANDCGTAEKHISKHAFAKEVPLGTNETDLAASTKILDLEKNNSLPSDGHSKEQERDLWLEVLSGERMGLLIRLASESLSLGRGRVDIRFNDPQISRYHAKLKRSDSGLIVTDQHSTNGLFVNENKVTKEEVAVDDVIRLGDTSLKVIYAK